MNHKLSKQNFIILVLVTAIMFLAMLFMVDNFKASLEHKLNPSHKKQMLVNKIHWALSGNHQQVLKMNRWMRIYIRATPVPGATKININDKVQVKKIISRQSEQMHFAIHLNNNRWLNIIFHKGKPNFVIVASNLAALIILIVLLCCFYYWLIERMSRPLRQLQYLAENISNDFGRLKLVNVNTPEVNAVVQAVNLLQSNIRKLMHDRTQTLAAISHDLRTPITRLKLRLEAFEDTPQYKKLILDLAEMERMIESVLGFVQNESEEGAIKFDLSALVETIIDDMSDAGFAVETIKIQGNISFIGQMYALKRALTNLIDNAVKYGRIAEISLIQENNKIIFTVDDQGPGIDEQEISKVFQPFYRVDKSRNLNTGGTGLGLVITKNIIQQNKGEISLRNLAVKGLRAQVIFQ